MITYLPLNQYLTNQVSSDDSIETISSRNENEADQSHHSPSSSSAALLRSDSDVSGKIASPSADVAAATHQYSPAGQRTSPAVTSLHASSVPPQPSAGHSMPSTNAMIAAAGNNYFPRYVNQVLRCFYLWLLNIGLMASAVRLTRFLISIQAWVPIIENDHLYADFLVLLLYVFLCILA